MQKKIKNVSNVLSGDNMDVTIEFQMKKSYIIIIESSKNLFWEVVSWWSYMIIIYVHHAILHTYHAKTNAYQSGTRIMLLFNMMGLHHATFAIYQAIMPP